ncbi:MAG: hypothetical protein QM767_05590 [Anaeromyxobacter sp.]
MATAANVLEPRLVEALGGLARLALELRRAGPALGIPVALVGLVAAVAGERLGRVTAAAGGALVGALAAQAAGGWLDAQTGLGAGVVALAAAGLLGAACAFWPMGFPVAAGGLVGALLGIHVPVGGHDWLGAVIAGAVGAGLCLVGARSVGVFLAAFAGGVALAAGLLATFGGGGLGAELAARPFALLGFGLVVGIAGASYQLSRAPAQGGKPGPPALET